MSRFMSCPIAALILSIVIPSLAYKQYVDSVPAVKFLRLDDAADGVPLPPEPEPTTPAPPPPPPTTTRPRGPNCSGTCQFKNSIASQILISCDGACVCAAKPGIMDAPSWNVIWNGTICTISESGPCGRGESGMVMACQPGLKCIEKRCREPSRVGSLELGWACDDSLDCQTGLACVSDENVFPVHKTCRILPKSLFRIW